jgi:hypothetical protein
VRRLWWGRALYVSWPAFVSASLVSSQPPHLGKGPIEADFAVVDHAAASLPPFGALSSPGIAQARPEPTCPVNCPATFPERIPIPPHVTVDQLRTSTVTLCFNAFCFSMGLASAVEQETLTPHFERFPATPESRRLLRESPSIFLAARRDAVGDQVEVVGSIGVTVSPARPLDGDRYDVTIRPARGGAPIARARSRLTYKIAHSSGPSCDVPCYVAARIEPQ